MAVDFTLSVQGQARLERQLHGLYVRTGDIHELMDRIGMVLETSTLERFDEERGPDGQKWTPSFRAEQEGGKTLTDTAGLRLSVRYLASADRVEIGSNKIYARAHNEGATITAKSGRGLAFMLGGELRIVRSVKLPKRQFLGLSRDDAEEIEAQFNDYVAEIEQ